MTHNDDTVRDQIEALKTVTAHAVAALQQLKNSGTGGGAIGGTTRFDFKRHSWLAVKSLEAVADQVDRISVRLETAIPIQDLRRILDDEKLRDSMSPDVRGAWNALSIFLGASPQED